MCYTMEKANDLASVLYEDDNIPYKIHIVPLRGKKPPTTTAVKKAKDNDSAHRILPGITSEAEQVQFFTGLFTKLFGEDLLSKLAKVKDDDELSL